MKTASPQRVQVPPGSHRNSADLVLRGYFEGKGEFGPIHWERIYGTCRRLRPLPTERPFPFAELTEILGAKSTAHRFLSACRSSGLATIEGEGRHQRYRFSTREDREETGTLEPTGKSRS